MGFRARGRSETEQRAARKLEYSAFSSRFCLFRIMPSGQTKHTCTEHGNPGTPAPRQHGNPATRQPGTPATRQPVQGASALGHYNQVTLQVPQHTNQVLFPSPVAETPKRKVGDASSPDSRVWRISSLKPELGTPFIQCTIKDTLTAKNSGVCSWTPQVRPKS